MNMWDIAKGSPDKKAAAFLGMITEGVDQEVDGLRCIGIKGMSLMQVVDLIVDDGIELPIFKGISLREFGAYRDMLEDDGTVPILNC